MRIQSFVRAATVAALLGAAVPGTARAQSFWDFVHLSGQGGDVGTSETYSLGVGFGTIVAWASSGFDVYSKGYDGALPNSDKGLGLCDVGQTYYHSGVYDCAHGSNWHSSYEIGDDPNTGGWLTLDFSNLAVGIQSITLSSLDRNEDYAHVYTKTSGSCTSSTGWTDRGNYTDNNSDDIFSLTSSSITGARCVKFASDNSGWGDDERDWWEGSYRGDYLVQGVWTANPLNDLSVTGPEPASMTLLGTGLAGLAGMARRRRKAAPKAE